MHPIIKAAGLCKDGSLWMHVNRYGKSLRRVQAICEEGVLLKPFADWRQLPTKPGSRQGGHFQIRRASVERLSRASGEF
jgi:hypothetical protein